jgi:hypothetical protein
MQSLLKATPLAACTFHVLLFVSLFISPLRSAAATAALAEGRRRKGAASLLSLRARHQIEAGQDPVDPEADPAGPTTSAAPTTTDIGKARVRESGDIAWKAAGEATEARAATSKLRSKINKLSAGLNRAEAEKSGAIGTEMYGPQATASEAAAKADLQKALAYEAEVRKILETVDAHSYKAAQIGAAKEVAQLEGEAKAYFQSLMAKFKALAEPGPPSAAQAAAKAAQPYIDVELRVGALVLYYNEKAAAEIATANMAAMSAHSIAVQAQGEQAAGIIDMAQRHMMQAHQLIGTANLKKAGAVNIRKLAESLNMSIPSYQRAAQMAAEHALATFTGLQMGDKAHIEMRQNVAKTTQQVDDGFKELEASLSQASKALGAMDASVSGAMYP